MTVIMGRRSAKDPHPLWHWEQSENRSGGFLRFVFLAAAQTLWICMVSAQELAPRAYVITPSQVNVVTVTWSFYDGSINYNGSLPVSDAVGSYQVPSLTYYRSFSLFGRSANAVASLPYGRGTFDGTVTGAGLRLYRSGLLDSVYRLSVNLMGGRAMPIREFSRWKQKTLLGVSVKVVPPTGQYDPTKLINWGTNRWSFKPELGYSRRFRTLVLDSYAGAWFFTSNSDFWSRNIYYSGTRTQSQSPIGAFEGHLSYDIKPRLWISLDGNYWFGGETSISGVKNSLSKESNSRLGGTFSMPITKHQSIKVSYSNGTYIRFGGNYQNVSAAWQYSWIGKFR
jgi:hypothetical protein